jgi:murein DD-endopeptidase MepM/ murein hydrolase activator NlpD
LGLTAIVGPAIILSLRGAKSDGRRSIYSVPGAVVQNEIRQIGVFWWLKRLALVLLWTSVFAFVTGCTTWRTPSPVCLAGAQLDDRGRCRAQQADQYHLPFQEGTSVRVTQGFHGFATHSKDLAYAVDFACAEGTPITAARDGVVWSARKDSNQGCGDAKCVDQANYVILDHGDGTYTSYYHLQHLGVFVEPGQKVCQGQLIGQCGDTGYATGTHLHFSVMSMQWSTIPVSFVEIGRGAMGMPLPRQSYESQNRRTSTCGDTSFSKLHTDAFAHQGIFLQRPVNSVVGAGDDEDRTMLLEGRYLGDYPNIVIHRREMAGDDWMEQCVALDDRGRFSVQIDWPEHIFGAGYYFLMLTGADEGCNAPGWAWSYRIRVFSGEDGEDDFDTGPGPIYGDEWERARPIRP